MLGNWSRCGFWPAVICAVLTACVPANDPPRQVAEASPPPLAATSDRPASADEMVSVTGVLTEEGVECQALRGEDGELYTVAGGLEGFEPGDRVRVVGRIAEMSFCMQGTTLGVQTVEPQP